MSSEIFKKHLREVPSDIRKYNKLLLDVSDQIDEYLEANDLNQSDLAKKMGKSEAEISKWMSGSHNFTIKTIAKISAALDYDILTTPLYVDELKEDVKEGIYNKLKNDFQTNIDRQLAQSISIIEKNTTIFEEDSMKMITSGSLSLKTEYSPFAKILKQFEPDS